MITIFAKVWQCSWNICRKYSLDITAANIRVSLAMFREYSQNISRKYSLDITPANIRLAGLPLSHHAPTRGHVCVLLVDKN